MKKVLVRCLKRLDIFLVFVITLITCSGCFNDSGATESNSIISGDVELVTMPSTSTIRFMEESLYIGYLGAKRDFALIVDNTEYNADHGIQGCNTSDSVGCSSTMAKLVITYGIKASYYTGIAGAENLLMYYTSSKDFDSYGDPNKEDSWYSVLSMSSKNKTGATFDNPDFKNDDSVNQYSCGVELNSGDSLMGSAPKHPSFCDYSKEMTNKGYSNVVGNAMILLFHNGEYYGMITDKGLDPYGTLNVYEHNVDTNLDDLVIHEDVTYANYYSEYYDKMINALKSKINVSRATNSSATSSGETQQIQVLKTISQLQDLRSSGKDYLLLITSDGFLDNRVGTNLAYDSNGNIIEELIGGDTPEERSLGLLLNALATFTDNCALQSSALGNVLKAALQTLLSGILGGLAGALGGAAIGFLIGGILPGVGHLIGAAAGAIVGAIIGVFAGIKANSALKKKMYSANGISENNYCKIVEAALTDIEINVPIYNYHIKSAKGNIDDYLEGNMKDSALRDYYTQNGSKCITQPYSVSVPSGLMSFFTDNLDSTFEYADDCEAELVQQVTGGFTGSPSLLFYLNNTKVDDLNGRVTSQLANEMLSVWGLKNVGDLYTIQSTSTREKMGFTFGAAQDVHDVKYCISSSSLPTCDGLQTTPVAMNSTYKYTFDPTKGISLFFTNEYKEFSNEKTREWLNSLNSDYITYNLNEQLQKTQYLFNRDTTNDNFTFGATELRYGIDAEWSSAKEVLNSVKTFINDNKDSDNVYQISYNDLNYLIFENENTVIGYHTNESNKVIIDYYLDESQGTEYIFSQIDDSTKMDFDSYYTYLKFIDINTPIRSAHDYYVYVAYKIDSQDSTLYYAYII